MEGVNDWSPNYVWNFYSNIKSLNALLFQKVDIDKNYCQICKFTIQYTYTFTFTNLGYGQPPRGEADGEATHYDEGQSNIYMGGINPYATLTKPSYISIDTVKVK